jgi:diketogulonate reductase-like aldo/keto reductase
MKLETRVEDLEVSRFSKQGPRKATFAAPAFSRELQESLKLIGQVSKTTHERRCNPGQLAWLLYQGDEVVTILRAKRRKYMQKPLTARGITLAEKDLARIEEATLKRRGRRRPLH